MRRWSIHRPLAIKKGRCVRSGKILSSPLAPSGASTRPFDTSPTAYIPNKLECMRHPRLLNYNRRRVHPGRFWRDVGGHRLLRRRESTSTHAWETASCRRQPGNGFRKIYPPLPAARMGHQQGRAVAAALAPQGAGGASLYPSRRLKTGQSHNRSNGNSLTYQ